MATIIGKCSELYHSKHLALYNYCVLTLLLHFLNRVISSKGLFRTSETCATRNDLFNVHVLFTCDIAIFPCSIFYVSIYAVKIPYLAQLY